MKSTTCYSKSGKPLSVYGTQNQAESCEKRICRINLVPYECDRCGDWHLSPKDRQTPNYECPYCAGRNGIPKDT